MSNFLTRRAECAAFSAVPLMSSTQIQMDGMLQGFTEGASDWRSLAAMTMGGLAYRATKLGVLGAASSIGGPAIGWSGTPTLARLFAPVLGLVSEVTIFRGTSRILSSHSSLPTPHSSWLTDFVNFASLKIFALASHNTNLIVSHALQAGGMVTGQHLAYGLNLATRPEGTITEQLAHAEMMNLQMQAGMSLGGVLTGNRLQIIERSLERSSELYQTKFPVFSLSTQPLPRMAAESRPKDRAAEQIFEIFHRARLRRLQEIRTALEVEKNPFKIAFLQEEAGKLDSYQVRDLEHLFNFLESLVSFHSRNISRGAVPALHWRRSLIAEMMRYQETDEAYDLFVRKKSDGNMAFYSIFLGEVPRLQRWRGSQNAPLFVREIDREGPFMHDEIFYVNLTRIKTLQDVVGRDKVENRREILRKEGNFKEPLQVMKEAYDSGELCLSDGNHRALAALREGYVFYSARYKGVIRQPALKIRFLEDLQEVSAEELRRLQIERDHGQGMTMASLEALAKADELNGMQEALILKALNVASQLPPFNTPVLGGQVYGNYPGRKGSNSEMVVKFEATSKHSRLIYMDLQHPMSVFADLDRIIQKEPHLGEGILALRTDRQVIAFQKFELHQEGKLWKLRFIYVWVDEAHRGHAYRDQLQKSILAAVLLALRSRNASLEVTFHQVRNPYNVARYLKAGLEVVQEDNFIFTDEDTPYSWGLPQVGMFSTMGAPPEASYRIRFPGQMLNGLGIPPHNL